MNSKAKLVIASVIWAMAFTQTSLTDAQELKFAKQQGPYYVGEPVIVQVIVSGLKSTDEAQCERVDTTPDGLTVEGPQVGRSSSSYMQIINGRVTKRDSIDYRFSYVITSNREIDFDTGIFVVTINGNRNNVTGDSFRFRKLEADPNMEIGFTTDRENIFVGEKIPVSIRWAYLGKIEDAQFAFSNLQIRSPLFDQFSFQDKPRQSRTTLTLATAKGGIEIDAVVTQETKNGKQLIVVTGERTLIADATGTFESVPITCRTKKVTRWGRDLFGDRVARSSVPALSVGPPLNFTVKSIPGNNRPASFAGAVGKGFTIEVTANRSVVRIGDPISLTINIRGDGNLDTLSLPEFSSQTGLSNDDFQFPSDPLSGTMVDGSKQFQVIIRAKNEEIDQVPSLSFSWFDPETEEFSTAASKPIALQVMETRIVSSSDVVAGPNSISSGSAPSETRLSSTSQDSLSFAGANLAIETDSARLLSNTTLQRSLELKPTAIYGVAVLFAMVALVLNRRSDDSIEKSKMRHQLGQIRSSIEKAGLLTGKDAFSQIADALREFIRVCEPTDRDPIERLIAECDTAIYARSDVTGASQTRQLITNSLAVLDEHAGRQ